MTDQQTTEPLEPLEPLIKPWAKMTAKEKRIALWVPLVAFAVMVGVWITVVALEFGGVNYDTDPVADACAEAVGIHDTIRLSRCIGNVHAGVSVDDAKEIDRTLERSYGNGR